MEIGYIYFKVAEFKGNWRNFADNLVELGGVEFPANILKEGQCVLRDALCLILGNSF